MIELEDLKMHLNITDEVDDELLTGKIAAASTWVLDFTGYELGQGVDEYPPPMLEAVRQLAGHLYENREASIVGVSVAELPFGLVDLLTPYREFAF